MSARWRGRAGEDRSEFRRPPQLAQIVGSIPVALAIAAIAVVTAHLGWTTAAVDDHGRSEDHSGRG